MTTILKYILPALLLTFTLSSCEKVIDIDLNSSAPQVVIEGNVSDQAGPYYVKISKSVNFSESNSFPAIQGATVIIQDNTGIIDTLKETTAGTYETIKTQGVSGRTYTIKVNTPGSSTTYTASSTMPSLVTLDSIQTPPSGGFGNSPRYVIPQLNDPAGIENYYYLIKYVNGKRISILNNSTVRSDRLTNGKTLTQPIFDNNPNNKTLAGDSVTIELQCIDKPIYDYYKTLAQVGGASQQATPSNPISNFNNNALGYFSAHTSSKKSVLILP